MAHNALAGYGHAANQGWPERFANVKPGDHLHWLYQGYWYEIRVTKFGLRDPLFFDVMGASRQCHPRFAMPSEADYFWIPVPGTEPKSEMTEGRMQPPKVSLSMRPKMSFINTLVPKEKRKYDNAKERGMVELNIRRKELPDRRMLMRKSACFEKLRYSEALLMGYPMEKLKLTARGRHLQDSETPESIGLADGEIVHLVMEPLVSPQSAPHAV